jgi:hypothetical protein
MEQTIRSSFAKSGVLDVLADDSGAFLVAAAKEIAAVVAVRRSLVYGFMIVLVGHGGSLSDQLVLVERPDLPKLHPTNRTGRCDRQSIIASQFIG